MAKRRKSFLFRWGASLVVIALLGYIGFESSRDYLYRRGINMAIAQYTNNLLELNYDELMTDASRNEITITNPVLTGIDGGLIFSNLSRAQAQKLTIHDLVLNEGKRPLGFKIKLDGLQLFNAQNQLTEQGDLVADYTYEPDEKISTIENAAYQRMGSTQPALRFTKLVVDDETGNPQSYPLDFKVVFDDVEVLRLSADYLPEIIRYDGHLTLRQNEAQHLTNISDLMLKRNERDFMTLSSLTLKAPDSFAKLLALGENGPVEMNLSVTNWRLPVYADTSNTPNLAELGYGQIIIDSALTATADTAAGSFTLDQNLDLTDMISAKLTGKVSKIDYQKLAPDADTSHLNVGANAVLDEMELVLHDRSLLERFLVVEAGKQNSNIEDVTAQQIDFVAKELMLYDEKLAEDARIALPLYAKGTHELVLSLAPPEPRNFGELTLMTLVDPASLPKNLGLSLRARLAE